MVFFQVKYSQDQVSCFILVKILTHDTRHVTTNKGGSQMITISNLYSSEKRF